LFVKFKEELVNRFLFIVFAGVLVACVPLTPVPTVPSSHVLVIYTSLPREMVSPVPTWMVLIPPSLTPTPIRPKSTPTALARPTPTGPACLELIEPVEGASFAKHDRIILKWKKLPGAASYVVYLGYPNGLQEKVLVSGTEMELNLQRETNAASYRWQVQAYDANHTLVCSSNSLTFTIYPVPVVTTTTFP
jgi:hypothetical protein